MEKASQITFFPAPKQKRAGDNSSCRNARRGKKMTVKQLQFDDWDAAHNHLDAAGFMLETLTTLIGCTTDLSEVRPDALAMTLYQVRQSVEQAKKSLH